jgi:hypothetical protein
MEVKDPRKVLGTEDLVCANHLQRAGKDPGGRCDPHLREFVASWGR